MLCSEEKRVQEFYTIGCVAGYQHVTVKVKKRFCISLCESHVDRCQQCDCMPGQFYAETTEKRSMLTMVREITLLHAYYS